MRYFQPFFSKWDRLLQASYPWSTKRIVGPETTEQSTMAHKAAFLILLGFLLDNYGRINAVLQIIKRIQVQKIRAVLTDVLPQAGRR